MTRISGYAGLAAVSSGDLLPIVDVLDTSMAPTGTTKQVTVGTLLAATMPIVAKTVTAGYTLVNGTGLVTGLTWTAPNDGNLHFAQIIGSLSVTSNETGGLIQLQWTPPTGSAAFTQVFAGGQSSGTYGSFGPLVVVKAGTTVSLNQNSALTVGAAVLWAGLAAT